MSDAEACAHLKRAVQIWDLASERVLEVSGPEARRLVRHLTPRHLGSALRDRRAYAPVCAPGGGMLGDPMVLRLDAERWWLTGAADLGPWIEGLARALSADARVEAPDVHPLAVQGPLAEELVSRVLGPGVRRIGPMGWRRVPFGGGAPVVARSDYTRQGGFEIAVEGRHRAAPLWDALAQAGRDLDLRVAAPNPIARIEGGLLLFGADVGPDVTPFEAGLGRLCDGTHDHVGRAALEAAREPARMVRPVEIDGPPLPPPEAPWRLTAGDARAGRVTSAAWAPEHGVHVAIATVAREHWEPGTPVLAHVPGGPRPARVRETFWT